MAGTRGEARSGSPPDAERALPRVSPAYDLGQTEPETRREWLAHVQALDE